MTFNSRDKSEYKEFLRNQINALKQEQETIVRNYNLEVLNWDYYSLL